MNETTAYQELIFIEAHHHHLNAKYFILWSWNQCANTWRIDNSNFLDCKIELSFSPTLLYNILFLRAVYSYMNLKPTAQYLNVLFISALNRINTGELRIFNGSLRHGSQRTRSRCYGTRSFSNGLLVNGVTVNGTHCWSSYGSYRRRWNGGQSSYVAYDVNGSK